MDLGEYQKRASTTDVRKHAVISLLGLSGEVGSLLSVYKKRLRDGNKKVQFQKDLGEEIGDILWYISNLASLNDLDMNVLAEQNLTKAQEFFGASHAPMLDEGFPAAERLPTEMRVEFQVNPDHRVQMIYQGRILGDSLSDNSQIEDNYKFHDAFHLAFMTHLHWSPNLRRLLKRKRKSVPAVDENEDGARACAVEEAAAAIVFAHASENGFFPSIDTVPLKLVSLLMRMTSNFEVRQCSSASWRRAIFDGSQAFQTLSLNRGGSVELDLNTRTFVVE